LPHAASPLHITTFQPFTKNDFNCICLGKVLKVSSLCKQCLLSLPQWFSLAVFV
jgi:hypothetical protein